MTIGHIFVKLDNKNSGHKGLTSKLSKIIETGFIKIMTDNILMIDEYSN